MIDFSALDVRDYILIAVALVGTYAVFSQLLQSLRMGRQRRRVEVPMRPEGDPRGVPDLVARAEPNSELQRNETRFAPPARPSSALGEAKEDTSNADFARELAHSSLELEVAHLRREAAQMRVEMTHLAEEMRNLRAAQNVSPLYREAMTLAQQGELPAGIAARCGISIGEAELVAALARSETRLEFHEKANDRADR